MKDQHAETQQPEPVIIGIDWAHGNSWTVYACPRCRAVLPCQAHPEFKVPEETKA